MVGDIQISMKRKHEEMEEEGANFTEQRQSILNISMCKLQTGSKRIEQSLRRSVLIFNTLKYIEHQLQQEGVKVTSQSPSSPLPDPQSSQLTLDPPPSPMPTNDSAAYNNNHAHGAQSGLSLLSSPDQKCNMELSDSSAEGSDKVSPLPSDNNKTPIEVATDLLGGPTAQYNISSFTSLFDLDSKTVGSANSTTSTTTASTSVSLSSPQTGTLPSFPSVFCSNSTASWSFPSSVPSSPGVFSSTATAKSNDLDLFGDIDLTLHDLDSMFASFSPSSKLAPLNAEELMHSFPGTGGMTDPAPFSSCSTSSMCCKNDIIHDELDHIMQILVEM